MKQIIKNIEDIYNYVQPEYVPGNLLCVNAPVCHVLKNDKKKIYCDYCFANR